MTSTENIDESVPESKQPNTQVKAFKLKNAQEVYGYVDIRKVDEVNPEIKVLQALGFIEEGSLYLGDDFSYLSVIESERFLSEEEYKKFLEKITKLEDDSNKALEKLSKLKEL